MLMQDISSPFVPLKLYTDVRVRQQNKNSTLYRMLMFPAPFFPLGEIKVGHNPLELLSQFWNITVVRHLWRNTFLRKNASQGQI